MSTDSPGLHVYVSVSPGDLALAHDLISGFQYDHIELAIDASGQVHDPLWKTRAMETMARADAVLVLVSPDSAASETCAWELAEAQRLDKRLFPLVCRSLPEHDVPEALHHVSRYIRSHTGKGWNNDQLWRWEEFRLRRDIRDTVTWERERIRLSACAARWEDGDKPDALLLDAASVDAADQWAQRRPAESSTLQPSLLEFLAASRENARRIDARRDVRAQIIQRAFVGPARTALDEGHFADALRRMAAGALLSDDVTFSLDANTEEPHRFALWRAALRAVQHAPVAVLRGHDDRISCLAFSRDGARALTGSTDKTARVWDVATGTCVAVLRGHHAGLTHVTLSGDGRRAVTLAKDHTVRVWDTTTGALVSRLRLHGNEFDMGFAVSEDATRMIMCADDFTARVWDVQAGTEIAVLEGHNARIDCVAFSHDATRLITGSDDGVAAVWDAATGAILTLLRGHARGVTCVALNVNGGCALTGADDTARVWDVRTGEMITVVRGHAPSVRDGGFSTDGTIVYTRDDSAIRVMNLAGALEPLVLKGTTGLRCAILSADGTRVLAGMNDRTVRLWDARTGAELVEGGYRSASDDIALGADGQLALTASNDTAWIWSTSRHAAMAVLQGHENIVTSIVVSPDGTRILSGSADTTARVWDARTGTELAVLRGHGAAVDRVAFGPDGSRAFTTSRDDTTRVWDADTGATIEILQGHGQPLAALDPNASQRMTAAHGMPVTIASPSAGGRFVITGAGDDIPRVWDARTGELISQLPKAGAHPLWAAAVSANGARALTSLASLYVHGPLINFYGDDVARVWDTASGTNTVVLRGHKRAVLSVAFSPDGVCALTGSADSTARLWDVATGAEIAVLTGHTNAVVSVTFSMDGTRAITGSWDKSIRIWDVSRWTAFDGDRTVFLTAALDCGVGMRSDDDRADLLMREAPDDLFSALHARLSQEQRGRTQRISDRLRAWQHPGSDSEST